MIPKNTREGPKNYSFKYMTQNERSKDVIRIQLDLQARLHCVTFRKKKVQKKIFC